MIKIINNFEDYDSRVSNIINNVKVPKACRGIIHDFCGTLWPIAQKGWSNMIIRRSHIDPNTEFCDIFESLELTNDNTILLRTVQKNSKEIQIIYLIQTIDLFEDNFGFGTRFHIKMVKIQRKPLLCGVETEMKVYSLGTKAQQVKFGKRFFHNRI